jgi:hypothetical protein
MFLQEMIPNRNIFYFYFVFLPQFYGEERCIQQNSS